MWDDEDETRPPMTDAEYAVWHAEVKAKIARSLADPRPALSEEELRRSLDRYIRDLYSRGKGAAA